MHICLITPSFPPMVDGGVAIATGRLAERLQQMGHEMTVLTAVPPTALLVHDVSWHGAGIQVVRHDAMVDDPRRDVAAVDALGAWAQQQHQQHPFDVILAYFIYPAGYLGVVLGASLDLPVICSCRGNDVSKAMFTDPQTIATVVQRSTHVIFVSDSLLHMADTLVPCRAKATIVANAVDSLAFIPAAPTARRAARPVVLGTSGIMRWKKGLDVFLPLIRSLCAAHPVRIVIAGYGLDAAVERRMTDFLAYHDLTSYVTITGPLPHRQMVQALQEMDIYVNTSYQEGMPNSILEAMACALPVVATDADAIPELVQDGITGYLCAKGDLEALVKQCRRLIEHPEQRRRMGCAGRHRAQHVFPPSREAQAVERVLRNVAQIA